MKPQCERCLEYYDRDAQFCGACGQRFSKRKGERGILENVMLLTAFIIAIYLVLETIVLLIKAPSVLSIIGDFGVDIFIVVPKSIRFTTIYGTGAEIYWIGIVITIFACVSYGLIQFIKGIREMQGNDKDDSPITKTAVYWVGILFCADILIQIVYALVAMSFGFEIDTSWMDQYTDEQLLYMLANASVWEELVSRVMLIGVPIALIQLYRTKKLHSFKYLLGGFGMNKLTMFLIIFSGIIFGMAHYYGWGMTKALITCMGGIIMGYVYVKFGLYASIIMHFLTDYLGSFLYCGMPAISAIGSIAFIGLGLFACVFIATKIPKKEKACEEFKTMPLLPNIEESTK
jgi:hypothetical protein